MLFKWKTQNKKRSTRLKPLEDTSTLTINADPVNPRVARRVKRLKRLRREVTGEDSSGKTIRVGDKKSAASLSLLFPGLGQIYMGQTAIGAAFVFSSISLFLSYLFLSGILRISVFSTELIPSYNYHIMLISPIAMAILSGISIHMSVGLFHLKSIINCRYYVFSI